MAVRLPRHDDQLLPNRRIHLVPADLLRGDFKQSQYGRVILPFTILRRLECVLESTKPKVLAQVDNDPIDLSSVQLSHYRLSKLHQQDLLLVKEGGAGLYSTDALGSGKPRDKAEEWLSKIIARLNELFITDGLTDQDLINYAHTIRDKISENASVMSQIANNSPEQALLGDFAGALDEAVMNSSEAHQNQMMQYLNSKELQAGFQRVVFDMLLAKKRTDTGASQSGDGD